MGKVLAPPDPSNVEAEQTVLGGILLEPEVFFQIDLKGYEFYLEKHRFVYNAMLDCVRADRDANFLNVVSRLSDKKELESVGGAPYLTSLLNSVVVASNAVQAADLVQHAYVQRSLIQKSGEIAGLGYGGGDLRTDELLTKAHEALQALEISPKERGVTMKESAAAVANEIDEWRDNPRETFGVPTHLDLDKVTNGLGKGDFIIVVGDPGMGKTALLHQIMLNIGLDGVRGRLYSFEMPHKRVTVRMACNLASINSKLLRRGEISDEEYEAVQRKLGEISALPLRIVDRPCSMEQINMDLARDERSGSLPDVVAIDYSKLLTDKGETEIIRVGNITRMGKVLAMRYGVTVVMVHVLNGEPGKEGRMPELRDLGWARQSQYDPDIVIATRLKDGKADIGILKNREGEWGNGLGISMAYIPEYTRWGNLANVPEPPRSILGRPLPQDTWADLPHYETVSA